MHVRFEHIAHHVFLALSVESFAAGHWDPQSTPSSQTLVSNVMAWERNPASQVTAGSKVGVGLIQHRPGPCIAW